MTGYTCSSAEIFSELQAQYEQAKEAQKKHGAAKVTDELIVRFYQQKM